MAHRVADVLVIGSGIAGLSVALRCARAGRVILITKKEDTESNTNYAQGGLAAVFAANDSPDLHVRDTLRAGADLCHPDIVDLVVREGPSRVHELVEIGVEFSRKSSGEFELGREGGHSRRRILHAADTTGREIERALIEAVTEEPAIRVFEHQMAVDLILESRIHPGARERCWGAYVLDNASGSIDAVLARATVLASGGSGRVYRFTSNPNIATGDGVAMAHRAGAVIGNLEFVQFHPTCLYHPAARSFLISEALRGEGGLLRNLDGERFMDAHHEDGELAPRDIVARAIDAEMKQRGDDHVWLDLTHLEPERVRQRFPMIAEKLAELGVDITRQPIPVVPAAHYQCGGVVTDTDGATSIPGLLAVGEVAMTGLHGANRLASNSLLEAVVFAHRAANHACEIVAEQLPQPRPRPWKPGPEGRPRYQVTLDHTWDEVRRLMWDYVGSVRSDRRLELAARRIGLLREEIEQCYRDYVLDDALVELRNLGLLADLIIRSAKRRAESRGLHWNVDHPERDDLAWRRDTLIAGERFLDAPPVAESPETHRRRRSGQQEQGRRGGGARADR